MWFSPNLLKFTIQIIGSRSQLCQVFDLRPLSYLEHWLTGLVSWHAKISPPSLLLNCTCLGKNLPGPILACAKIYMQVAWAPFGNPYANFTRAVPSIFCSVNLALIKSSSHENL